MVRVMTEAEAVPGEIRSMVMLAEAFEASSVKSTLGLKSHPGWEITLMVRRIKEKKTTKKAKRNGTDQSRDEAERA